MLVLSRRKNESLMIGDSVEIVVVDVRGDKARLGIIAPPDVTVHRKEIFNTLRSAEHDSPAATADHRPSNCTIREATTDDLSAINAIYNHYVLESTCTYQHTAETPQERCRWFEQKRAAGEPVLVGETDGKLAAWATYGSFRSRSGFSKTVEHALYVQKEFHARHIGQALLDELIQRARAAQMHAMIGVIDSEQTASLALHAKLGFEKAGRLRQAGFKFGRWLDAILVERLLDERPAPADAATPLVP